MSVTHLFYRLALRLPAVNCELYLLALTRVPAPTSSRVSRAAGAPGADRSVDPPPTTGSSTSRAGPHDQLRRPDRFHPSADRHVHDSHVLRRRQRRAPLLCCSARCFGDIYVLCASSSVPSSFSYSPLGPFVFPYCCNPRLLVRACNIVLVSLVLFPPCMSLLVFCSFSKVFLFF